MIDFGSGFASSTLHTMTSVVSGFATPISLIVGVLLAVLAATFLIHALHK